MESNRQSTRWCSLCTALSSQWCFSHKVNWCDAAASKTDRPADTMFHRQSVETGYSPCFYNRRYRKRSATNMFLHFDRHIERISLLAASIATHQSHTNSKPILSNVSSTINSSTFLFLEESLFGLYFWIQFQMETLFRLIKHDDSLSEALLKESPEK